MLDRGNIRSFQNYSILKQITHSMRCVWKRVVGIFGDNFRW